MKMYERIYYSSVKNNLHNQVMIVAFKVRNINFVTGDCLVNSKGIKKLLRVTVYDWKCVRKEEDALVVVS